MSSKEAFELLKTQIKILSDWNESNGKCEPEQARKNAETMIQIVSYITENCGW